MERSVKFKLFIGAIAVVVLVAPLVLGPLAQDVRAQNPSGPSQGPSGEAETPGGEGETPSASSYLSNLYVWFLGFVGVAALFALIYGGVLYMASGANIAEKGRAKRWISNAIFGILLAAASYLILYTINPDLILHGFDIETLIQERTGQSAP